MSGTIVWFRALCVLAVYQSLARPTEGRPYRYLDETNDDDISSTTVDVESWSEHDRTAANDEPDRGAVDDGEDDDVFALNRCESALNGRRRKNQPKMGRFPMSTRARTTVDPPTRDGAIVAAKHPRITSTTSKAAVVQTVTDGRLHKWWKSNAGNSSTRTPRPEVVQSSGGGGGGWNRLFRHIEFTKRTTTTTTTTAATTTKVAERWWNVGGRLKAEKAVRAATTRGSSAPESRTAVVQSSDVTTNGRFFGHWRNRRLPPMGLIPAEPARPPTEWLVRE